MAQEFPQAKLVLVSSLTPAPWNPRSIKDLMKAVEAVRTKVLDLHATLQRFERFKLPEPGEDERELVAGF